MMYLGGAFVFHTIICLKNFLQTNQENGAENSYYNSRSLFKLPGFCIFKY